MREDFLNIYHISNYNLSVQNFGFMRISSINMIDTHNTQTINEQVYLSINDEKGDSELYIKSEDLKKIIGE